MTPEDYLASEVLSEVKREYVAGYVYAMAGASKTHNRIVGNLVIGLGTRLRGKRCEPFSSDMKARLQVGLTTTFYYPDVMVLCEIDETQEYFQDHPAVIFEVISPSSSRYDYQEKLLAYQTIPTLRAYVIVEQSKVHLTVYRREGVTFSSEVITDPAATLRLPEIECELAVAEIYERTGL